MIVLSTRTSILQFCNIAKITLPQRETSILEKMWKCSWNHCTLSFRFILFYFIFPKTHYIPPLTVNHWAWAYYHYLSTVTFCGHTHVWTGGGALALSHAGVLKALISVGLLPRVVSGTSGGALCAGVLATHTDEEILETTEPNIVTRHDPYVFFSCVHWRCVNRNSFERCPSLVPHCSLFSPSWPFCRLLEPLYIQIRRFLNEGVLADYVKFSFAVRQYIGDYTFEEAYVPLRAQMSGVETNSWCRKASAFTLTQLWKNEKSCVRLRH